MLSELVQQLSQGAVREAELLGDFRLCSAFHKHGAQCLVTAVIRLGGLGEELPAAGVVHDQCSLEMSVDFAGQTKADDKVKTPTERCESPPNPRKTSPLPPPLAA